MYVSNLTSSRYAILSKSIDTVIIPVGSLEAHGMHCPLGTDNIIPERFCREIEAKLGDEVLIAPIVNYGYTPSLTVFSGTVSLPAETLISLYTEIGLSFVRWGAKNIVFMNGHGGNIALLTIAADRIAAAGGTCLTLSWWATFSADILKVCETQGHAGEDETSAVLAIDASLVDDSKRSIHMKKAFCLPLTGPTQISHRYPNGMSGDSTKASVEKGERLFALMLEKNLEYIGRLRKGEFTDSI
jgi:creatinine amidohydrolase